MQSPEVEPELSVLLYVCSDCKAEVVNRQLEDPVWFEEKPEVQDVMSQLVKIYYGLCDIKESIQNKDIEASIYTPPHTPTKTLKDHIAGHCLLFHI